MSSQSLKCPVCFTFLDTDQHTPSTFSSCGHTICKECSIIGSFSGVHCAFDGNFQHGNHGGCFAANFLAKDLLDMKHCPYHEGEQLNMICFTDHTLVCHDCIAFCEHQEHEVKLLSDFEKQVKSRKDELELLSEKLSKTFDEMMTSLLLKRCSIENTIQQRYHSLYAILRQQENELLSKVNTIFWYEANHLRSELGQSSDLAVAIQKQLRELDNIMSNPDINKTNFTIDLDRKLINLNICYEQELPILLEVLQNSIPKEDLFDDLDIMMEPLNQQLIQFSENRVRLLQNNNDNETIIFEAKLDISFSPEGTIMRIHSPPSNSQSHYEFDRIKLAQVQSIEYYLTQNMYSPTVLKIQSLLSKYLINLESVFIETQGEEFQDIHHETVFLSLLQVVFSNPQGLRHICLVCKQLEIGELGLIFFCEQLLPRIPDLKSLSLDLRRTITQPRALQAVSNIDCSNWPNLEEFNIILIDSIFHEECFKKFLNNIPNVREVFLNLANIPLSDKIIEDFSVNVLSKLDKVKILKIELWKTELTDIAIQKFLVNLPNSVSKLVVGLTHLKITDASLQDFLERKLPLLTDMKELNLMVSHTNLSIGMCNKISQQRKFFY